jgi:Domain of unknown function (DUF4262)
MTISDDEFDRNVAKFQKGIDDDIERVGRSIVCVFAEDDKPGFAYTIGNALKWLPELLIVGYNQGDFLNGLSEKMIKRDRAFDDGEVVVLDGGHSGLVKIINTDKRAQENYTFQATFLYGHDDYRVQQVLFRDLNGFFPTAKQYSAQRPMPLLSKKWEAKA